MSDTDFSLFGYFDMLKMAGRLAEKYKFLKVITAGKSVMGKDILALRIGRSAEYVLLAGGFHGSEHITATLLLRFAEELCFAIQNDEVLEGLRVRRALYDRGIIVLPTVNPDGCEIARFGASATGGSRFLEKIIDGDYSHFNANARGVDINHNFAAGWSALREREKAAGIMGPAKTRFGGYAPESEPETAAICELCRALTIRHALAFHSQGEVIYPPDGDNPPKRSLRMAEIMSAASGYALDRPEGLAVGGGFKDWFVKEFNRPAFTVEVGKGQNPLPPADYSKIYRQVRELMMLACIM